MRFGCEKTNEGGIKKKKAIYPRQPIFVNLKSNTMKNTVQRYRVYVIQHNVFSKIFYLLTLINFESSVFLLLLSLISHTSGEMSDIRMETWFRPVILRRVPILSDILLRDDRCLPDGRPVESAGVECVRYALTWLLR